MRRALLIGLIGVVVVVGGFAWYVATAQDAASDARRAGMRTAVGCIALGGVLMAGGAVDARRHRQKAGTRGEDDRVARSSPVIRPTIIVRQHRRRHRPTPVPVLRVVPAWMPPELGDKPAGTLDSVRADQASLPNGETATGDIWPEWFPRPRKAPAPISPWPPPPD
jgi:hypothetical protein